MSKAIHAPDGLEITKLTPVFEKDPDLADSDGSWWPYRAVARIP